MINEGENGTVIISGRVHIPRPASTRTAKVVWVRVLDISRADAPSQTVAEHQLRDVEIRAGDGVEVISFLMDDIQYDDRRADLSVAVHVDWSGSGNVEPGDLLSTRTYPIDPEAGAQSFDIEVRQV